VRPFVESRGVQELSGELSVGQIKRHAAFNDDALNLHVKKISIVTTLQQRHAWRIVAHPHVWHSVQSRRFGNVQSTRVENLLSIIAFTSLSRNCSCRTADSTDFCMHACAKISQPNGLPFIDGCP